MSVHDEMLDSVAAYALGALDANEAVVVETHLHTCAECQAEYDALRPVVTAVGNAVGNEAVPSPLLKARIMQQVRVQQMRPSRNFAWLAYAIAAACLLLALGLGTIVMQQRQTITTLSSLSERRIYVVAHGLPRLPAGKVYQMWTLAKGATKVAPSVTFVPDSAGDALVAVPADPATTAEAAISVEPAGGSQQPTTKPIAVIPIQNG
jgi:anti-sigma-K factor RskA